VRGGDAAEENLEHGTCQKLPLRVIGPGTPNAAFYGFCDRCFHDLC
jgi:hypothetical protein